MSKKQDREIEQKADGIITALKLNGRAYLIEDGFSPSSAIVSRVRALCQNSDLVIKDPQFKGDGDYEFLSANHLGTKAGL